MVKKAIHKVTNTPLAVKIINVYDKGKRHQLYNELKANLDMFSPYLLQCFGAFFEEGSVRLVLEFMDCGSLETIIKVVNELTKASPTPVIPRIPEIVISRFLACVSICLVQNQQSN